VNWIESAQDAAQYVLYAWINLQVSPNQRRFKPQNSSQCYRTMVSIVSHFLSHGVLLLDNW
jgi:hypothetical protein